MNNKNPLVFTDFHHAGLLFSLILLFEKRLDGFVYRPIGTEWYHRGFWKVFNHPATVEQYLGMGQGFKPADGTPPLNIVQNYEDKVYYCQDIDSGFFNRAITLETFLEMPIDIVIASIPAHIEPFKKLCSIHRNQPKLIFQIGNAWTVEAGLAGNVMASAIINDVPPSVNFISYHQEFDLATFHPADFDQMPEKKISTFVNCFGTVPHLEQDFRLFADIEFRMPEWDFKSYGGQCRDGAAHGSAEVAQKMRDSMFIWHTKQGGDGYGHVVFNTGAVGRPTIVKKQYYLGKLAEKLFIDGETCIEIDSLSPEEIVNKINYYSDPYLYKKMCENTLLNFQNTVDFDKEAENIRVFLQNLI